MQDYKCLRAVVMICAILVDQSFDFFIPTDPCESRSNKRWLYCQLLHSYDANLLTLGQ